MNKKERQYFEKRFEQIFGLIITSCFVLILYIAEHPFLLLVAIFGSIIGVFKLIRLELKK